ncbi:S9 family peptidase [Ramlibacter sp. WS9]|uniref:alpha/beta hydrolase family protein n=1 Tax=Ramlibacter sp. WS9 TaxID=1882741 RepID=UPI0011422962|nr:alpha/beta hydrolase [Ramlibacter sp. WS9]ROZ74347.1 alpha/beta hydrolase [Ramlibacter sp. WS9]
MNKLTWKVAACLWTGGLAAATGTTLAQSAPQKKAAESMSAFCQSGPAEYPEGVAGTHPSFKFNICWWLEDAGIEATTFDEVAKSLPPHASPFQPAWQSTFSKPALAHAELARLAEDRGDKKMASAEYKKAAFYHRMNRLPKRSPALDLQATEKAHAAIGKPLQRVTFKTGGKEFIGYYRAPVTRMFSSVKPPVVVILGGLDNFKTEMIRHSDHFVARGIATFIVENPDTGENQLSFRPEAHVMFDAIADHIKSRTELDASRVAIYGWSMGGYLATLGGLRNDLYKAIVNIGGPSDTSFGQAHCKVAPAWIIAPYALFGNMDPRSATRQAVCTYYEEFQLSRQLKAPTPAQLRKPILMVNGVHEDLVARDEPASLAALGLNVTQLIYGSDGHTAELNMKDHLDFSAAWLLRQLGPQK